MPGFPAGERAHQNVVPAPQVGWGRVREAGAPNIYHCLDGNKDPSDELITLSRSTH